MARIVVTTKLSNPGSQPVVPVTAITAAALLGQVAAMSPHDRALVADTAMDTWGFCGVGTRAGTAARRRETPTSTATDAPSWTAVILIAPSHGLPRSHPLSLGGIDAATAGLALVYIPSSSLTLSRQLCADLVARLRPLASGLEARAAPYSRLATTLSPPRRWLTTMGFQPMRYPINHYRMDFDTTVARRDRDRVAQWSPRPVIGLATSRVAPD
ncbi:MAG: hypothetical protein LBV06_00095 [Propionibacteriaceae bacterium]|jgi:hypothetical protein|nr:hypothetical protein [Propionibacteriaceae bacterium]